MKKNNKIHKIFKPTIRISIIFIFLSFSICFLLLSQNKTKKPEEKKKVEFSERWKNYSDSDRIQRIELWKSYLTELKKSAKSGFIPKEGVVPDEETAIKIAEIVWLKVWGDMINESKPFVAVLVNNGTVWRVAGTLPPNLNGGTPMMDIRKKDGKIIYILHGK